MTPQEEQLLQSLADKINATQLQEKDQDAESFLNQNLAPNPDAIYILAQTVLVQNIALEQAKTQIAQLQQAQQTRQPSHTTSFLGSLLGRHDEAAPQPPTQPNYPVPSPAGFQPVQQGPFQSAPPVQYAPVPAPSYAAAYSSGPGFLRGAMQTAAGVAAGALAFEGVESVLHGLSGGSGWGGPGFGMGGGFERPAEETVINNYYDEPGGREAEHHEGGEQHFHESADQGSAQFSDASYNTAGGDRGYDDQSSMDNSNIDDNSGGFDDSGSFDDSGDFGSGDNNS